MNYQHKPLTIIKMLDETVTNQSHERTKNIGVVISRPTKQSGIRE